MTQLYTADICDDLGGNDSNDMNASVQVLGKGFVHFGGHKQCQGEIVTVRLDKHNGDLIKVLRDYDGAGKVVVVDVDEAYFAVVGENLMKFAHLNGYAGIIVNGFVRDTLQIADIPVVLMALGTCPRKYMQPLSGEVNKPLRFAGVHFNPGAWLYTDQDGAIVLPSPLGN